MSDTPGAEATERGLNHVRRQTRWLAAVLEGGAAAAFVFFFLRKDILGQSIGTMLASSFIANSATTYLLWPLVGDMGGIRRWRAAICGVLIVPLAGFL